MIKTTENKIQHFAIELLKKSNMVGMPYLKWRNHG